MKKFVTRSILKELALKEKAKGILISRNGSSVLSDHAGLVIVGVICLALIIAWASGFITNTLLPMLGNRLTGLIS